MSLEYIQGDIPDDMILGVEVNGVAENIDDATQVNLHWVKPDDTETLVALIEEDFALGTVKRVWEAGDTDLAGAHRGRVVVTRSGGELNTFPTDGGWFYWWVNPSSPL